MSSEWSLGTVGDFFQLVSGYAFKGHNFSTDGVPVIKIKNIKAGYFSTHQFSYVSPDFLDTQPEKIALFDDLLISMSGNRHDGSPETWVGKVAHFGEKNIYLINQRVGALRLKQNATLDARFTGFLLSSLQYQEHFISIATSSGGQANLSPAQILSTPVRYPKISEQRAISHILGTLDDKIKLNSRMNETLEAMARALFKSWFIDFDPVRAKMEGRDIGLPKHIADLFPDRMVDSEIGKIPEGWKVGMIGNLASILGGTTPSTKERQYWEHGSHCWATPKDLSDLQVPVLLDTERKITDLGLSKIGSGLLPKGTVLLSSRAPIGYLAVTEIPAAINQGFIAMLPFEKVSTLFLLYWCDAYHDKIESHANGSTFLEISKGNFRQISIVIPSMSIIEAFDTFVRPLFNNIVSSSRESQILYTLRDALLPKLISGELRVKMEAK